MDYTEEERALVEEVSDRFVREIGGADQDPYDPAYLQRWMSALSENDRLLKAYVGWRAFNRLQLAAMQATYAEQRQ